MLRRNRKSSKRNPKPFRRFDEVDKGYGISSFEWLVLAILIVMFLVMVYHIVSAFLVM